VADAKISALTDATDFESADEFPLARAGATLKANGSYVLSFVEAALTSLYQPLDSDLTAIAALTTTSFGRGLLTLANAAAGQTALGLVIGANVEAWDADLDDVAALTPTNDDILQRKSGHWTNRTMAQLIADLSALGTTFQPLDSDLTAIAALTTTAFGRGLLTAANAAGLGITAADVGALAATAAAGGDLTGNYPNPTIGSAKVTTAKLAAAVTLDAIATANATGANIAMNSHKLTGLSAGSGAGDSVRYEQALLSGAVTAADGSIVVAGTGVAPTVATGTLDAIAAAHAPAANWSNNSHKITSVSNGTAAQDAATVAQLGVTDRTSGTSTSGTPGTAVASITAGAGNQLVAWTCHAAQTSAAGTQLTVTITYTDSTTTTATSPASSTSTVLVNAGGILIAGTLTAGSAKEVSSIAVITAGTGTGSRVAAIAAMEVPQ
jgi:hypothetical protein